MKISMFLLSLCGLSVVYLCYADWIDDLLEAIAEDYLGYDYEEVAPFIPSGSKEFDSMVETLSDTAKNKFGAYFAGAAVASLTLLFLLARFVLSGKCLELVRRGRIKLKSEWNLRRRKTRRSRNEVSSWFSSIFNTKSNRQLRSGARGDDVPVQVIWKGNGLLESSVHCNLKDKVHKETLRGGDVGAGDVTGHQPPGKESTAQRLEQIRKLLESEPETMQKLDKSAGTEDFPESFVSELRQRLESDASVTNGSLNKKLAEENKSGLSVDSSPNGCEDQEKDPAADPKLMNRIRLLESRLRLEELKNRSWITRMSRAEGILQQLNKQVERIESSRPVETTLLETLKITSTITNWMPVTRPRTSLRFTMVKQEEPRFESLSEYVKREIPLPCASLDPKRFMPLPKSPVAKSLPTQPSFLSKFLSK